MTTKGAAFLRARSPEHKRQRYEAILDAARELAVREGVGAVSLADIAARVGMHKSALLKYFGTREEIFLRLSEAEWQAWADAVVPELDAGTADDTDRVAVVLAGSLNQRPLFCQLLIYSPLTLEHNVSLDAARSAKLAAMRAVDAVSDAMHRALPVLGRAACFDLLAATGLVAAGLWQATHPSPVIAALHAELPPPAEAKSGYLAMDFETAVARFVRVHLTGLLAVDGAE
jgi:AcrR family transcriptional regulator